MIDLAWRGVRPYWRVVILTIYLLVDIALFVSGGGSHKPDGESDETHSKLDIIKTMIKTASEHATHAVDDLTPSAVLARIRQCEWSDHGWSNWQATH